MSAALIRKILSLCEHIAAGSSPTAYAALAADIRAELDPPPQWKWIGDVLHVGDRMAGRVGRINSTGLWWTASTPDGATITMHDEFTARAVVVAIAGFDPGVTFIFRLHPDWTREDIDAARSHGLGCYVAALLESYAEGYAGPQHTEDPDAVRRWWAGGNKALTLSAKEYDDENPF